MNRCASCLLISATRSLCDSLFLAFMTRTMDASTRCLRSSSTVDGTPHDPCSPPSSSVKKFKEWISIVQINMVALL